MDFVVRSVTANRCIKSPQ